MIPLPLHQAIKAPAFSFSMLSSVMLSLFFWLTAWTTNPANTSVPGLDFVDLRVLFILGGTAGLAFVAFARQTDVVTIVWLAFVTACAFGRGLGLLLIGDPDLLRDSELRGGFAWFLLWALGIVCVFVITAYAQIAKRNELGDPGAD